MMTLEQKAERLDGIRAPRKRSKIVGSFVAAMMSVACLLVPGFGAEKAATRILRFPEDQFVGSLYIEDPCLGTPYLELGRDLSLPLGLDPKRVCLGGDWDFVGLAKGDVAVPAGRNIKLMVMMHLRRQDAAQIARLRPNQYKIFAAERCCDDPNDLSGLSQLRPDDLYMLQVSSLVRTADADQRIIEPISRLTGLQMLSLHKTGVTDKGMELLKRLRLLRALEFMEERIGVSGLNVLKDLPNLEYLDCGIEPTDAGLKQVAQVSSLRWLSVATGNIQGPGLAELAALPRLERLCIHGTSPISDRHIKYLEGLTQLKSLTLWSCCDQLTDASLASIGKLKSLEELYFIRTMPRFTAAGQVQLRQLKHLRKLDLAGVHISDARYLTELPQLESVKPVDFTAENMKALSGVGHLKSLGVNLPSLPNGSTDDPTAASYLGALGSLEELIFSGSAVGRYVSDEDVACLASLGHLKKLHVGSNHLTDRSLASISKLDRLESLDLSGSVTIDGLNRLRSLTNLQTLDVKVYPDTIRPSDAIALDLSALANLKTLTLSGFSLQDADLLSLAGLRHLEWLVLDGAFFTEEGLWRLRNLSEVKLLDIRGISCTSGEHLDELGGMAKLGDLKLHGRITDAALGCLGGLSSLWSLSVETDEPIRPETLTRIRKAIPTLMCIHVSKPAQLSPPATMRNQRHAPANQPRVNQRTQQNRPRRR